MAFVHFFAQIRLLLTRFKLIVLGIAGVSFAGLVLAGWLEYRKQPFVPEARSALWGETGEAWDPGGILGDFSYAGYAMGGELPVLPAASVNVVDFGAVGDGVVDDTVAFERALDAVGYGVVHIPAGTYRILRVLRVDRPGIVLKGDGIGRTILDFPKPLSTTTGSAPRALGSDGHWSWGGGYLWFQGEQRGEKIVEVTGPAMRGQHELRVADGTQIKAGEVIRLVLTDVDESLWQYLHGGTVESGPQAIAHLRGRLVDFASSVRRVRSDGTIVLDRPLPTDVRMAWHPAVYANRPTTHDVGIQDMTLSFPATSYAGHLTEAGYNAIYLHTVQNFWIRNIDILNADSGILIRGPSRFGTVSNVRLANDGRGNGITGHHGIALEGPHDVLVTRFRIETMFRHDLTIDSFSSGNVFSKGRGVDLCFDHHRGAPHDNLFSDIETGRAYRLWFHGGPTSGWGPPSGVRETFWNIRVANRDITNPPFPLMVSVGMRTDAGSDNQWVERIDPAKLRPQDIHLAQLERRRLQAQESHGI